MCRRLSCLCVERDHRTQTLEQGVRGQEDLGILEAPLSGVFFSLPLLLAPWTHKCTAGTVVLSSPSPRFSHLNTCFMAPLLPAYPYFKCPRMPPFNGSSDEGKKLPALVSLYLSQRGSCINTITGTKLPWRLSLNILHFFVSFFCM